MSLETKFLFGDDGDTGRFIARGGAGDDAGDLLGGEWGGGDGAVAGCLVGVWNESHGDYIVDQERAAVEVAMTALFGAVSRR